MIISARVSQRISKDDQEGRRYSTDGWECRNHLQVLVETKQGSRNRATHVLKHLDMQGPNLAWCWYARPRMMEKKQWFRHLKPEDVKKLGVSELYPRIGLFVEFCRTLLQRLHLDANPSLSFSSPVGQVQDRIAPIKIWTAHQTSKFPTHWKSFNHSCFFGYGFRPGSRSFV